MRKILIAIVFVYFSITLYAQNEIVIGKKDTLFSKVLNEKREIWVSVPSDYRDNLKNQKFPVVFVLDGPDNFFSVVGMVDRFSNNIGNEVCPPMIVVGLVNTDRNRDFYPEKNNDLFEKFLKDELLSYVDRNYPTQPYRIFIGHSLAGLRVVKTAIFDKDLFNGIIAIEPSLGDKKNKWYDETRGEIEKFSLGTKRMYVAMGQTMHYNQIQDTALIKKDTTSDSNHMRRIMEFSEKMISKNTFNNPDFQWKFYPEETHQSLVQISIYDGLKFIFNWYKPVFWNEFFYAGTTSERAIELYDNYFKTLSVNLGYVVKSPFDDSMLIWYLDYKMQYDKALALAKYNIAVHPDSEKPKEWIDKLEKKVNKK